MFLLYRWFLVFITLIPCFMTMAQEKRIHFKSWKFGLDLPQGHHRPSPMYDATVPGAVHLDLMNNLQAEGFYLGLNEHTQLAKSIEQENWVYLTSFLIDSQDLQQTNLELVFEGLDTYAKVYLNDSLILIADNMFRTWKVDVKNLLQVGYNRLEVHFISPLNYHQETVFDSPYELPSGNETVDVKVSAYSRKAAYHFGWDWGPRFVTCGIWKPCYIRSWSSFRIHDFWAETKSLYNDKAQMQFHFSLYSDSSYQTPFTIEMMGKEFEIYIKQGWQQIDFYHEISEAKLWWPNGHGSQPIYSSTVNLFNPQDTKVHTTDVRFAIRTVELVNEKDSIGTSFYFKINGKPIFMKGANYIPQDLFLPSVSEQRTQQLLMNAQALDMNMLRVWGGGIYESDFFYDQCDLRGILIWQDLMFANSMYPADTNFHNNVLAEVNDNVKRLRNHPCIALWCGNNEIEVAWHNWGWQKQYGYSDQDSTEIWQNYLQIFHELIPNKITELDPTRSYIPSSPQSNWGKPENFNHGAMHYWGVWHGREPIENFETNVGRFMVEYGFQSYPDAVTLSQYLNKEELNLGSEAFKNRQKSYIGNELIEKEIAKYVDKLEGIEDWLLMSQFVQAQALKKAIIAHRLKAPHCMGTLFWQLNDCWPGASWSILDYNQVRKLAYHEVQKWYSPTIAVTTLTSDSLIIKAHSDIGFQGDLVLRISNGAMEDKIDLKQIQFGLKPFETKTVYAINLKKLRKYEIGAKFLEVQLTDELNTGFFYDVIPFAPIHSLDDIRRQYYMIENF